MNRERRKVLEQATELLSQALELVQSAHADEEEGYEALPSPFQESERGVEMQAAIEALLDADGAIETAMMAIGEAVE